MLSCREVVKDADLLIAHELLWRKRLAMRMHLILCKHCRRYVRQLKKLIAALPFIHSKASDVEVNAVMDTIQKQGRDTD